MLAFPSHPAIESVLKGQSLHGFLIYGSFKRLPFLQTYPLLALTLILTVTVAKALP
jgi:hypothetical protein